MSTRVCATSDLAKVILGIILGSGKRVHQTNRKIPPEPESNPNSQAKMRTIDSKDYFGPSCSKSAHLHVRTTLQEICGSKVLALYQWVGGTEEAE